MPGEYPVSIGRRIRFIKEILDFINAQMPDRFLFIKKHVFPALAELGVDPEYLWRLTEENPRRIFEQ